MGLSEASAEGASANEMSAAAATSPLTLPPSR